MEQIKLFKRYSKDISKDTEKFEAEVNQWLLDNKNSIKVKDIKYTSVFPKPENDCFVTWTVMVIYETDK